MNNFENKISIVCSVFNSEITEQLLAGSLARLAELGVREDQIEVFKVPGAIEIPLVAKLLAQSNKYQAIISLGCVIRGETSHYDYVCQQVSHGCQQVMLEFNIPVIFGVLTTNNLKQAKQRVSKKSHKGIEAADAAIQMVSLLANLDLCPIQGNGYQF